MAFDCEFPDDEGGSLSSDGTFDNQGISYVNAGDLVLESGTVFGSGSFVFVKKIADESGAAKNYRLVFTLEDDASLELTVHADEFLAGGIDLEFKRDGIALDVLLSASGTVKDVSSAFKSVNAASEMDLYVDVYNGETPARVIVWSDDDNQDNFTLSEAVFDSTGSGLTVPGNGSGLFWGLTLNPATVQTATVSDVKLTP